MRIRKRQITMLVMTKEYMADKLRDIATMGYITRMGVKKRASIERTLYELLGLKDNKLPIYDNCEWQLRVYQAGDDSLKELLSLEPSPKAFHFLPNIFLPLYGWTNSKTGEQVFTQTVSAYPNERGFSLWTDYESQKVRISFDHTAVHPQHMNWLNQVKQRVGLEPLNPPPHWEFAYLKAHVGTKLLNCFFVEAQVKKIDGVEHFWYSRVLMLERFRFEGFIDALETGAVLVDFDARTGHNHGTKFRVRQGIFPNLYETVTPVVGTI